MKKNKLFGYVMTGALSLGVLGSATIPAFAATETTSNSTTVTEQAFNVKASLDDETKQKVQAIMEELNTNLTELGVELPTKGTRGGDFLANLDDETKVQAQAILDEEKAGTITKEEAQSQLADLGVDFPAKGDKGARGDFLANLDDETKEQAQAILDQERAGTITREEAQLQLADLGVDFPAKGDKGARGDFLANLDDETKEQAQALIDEAEEELAELGIDHLPFKGFHNQSNE